MPMGEVHITPVPYMVPLGVCVVHTNIFPDDPDHDSHWDEKYQLFSDLVDLCLALKCFVCHSSEDFVYLVRELEERQYRLLLDGLRVARNSALGHDRVALLQRREDLHRFWMEAHPSSMVEPLRTWE
jgi:hypothetical protein